MKLQELSELISVREFVYKAIDDVNIKLPNDQLKLIRAKLPNIDKAIITGILEMSLPATHSPLAPKVLASVEEPIPSLEAKALKDKKNASFRRSEISE